MAETVSQRLRRVERALEAGRVPTILTYLPGADVLVRAYGLVPGKDIFLPQPGDDPAFVKRAREQIRSKRAYKKARLATGESYLSQRDRRQQSADKLLEHYVTQLNKIDKGSS